MSDHWFYERTADGWEVRDENRLLVAVVPDAQHEREDDARRIVERGPARQQVQPDAELEPARPRPRVTLVGTDRNAFAALGRARPRAAGAPGAARRRPVEDQA
jgi:hypothetical protein